MDIGFAAPVSGSWATRDAMVRIATRAEELHQSTTEALAAAQQAVKSDAATRAKRMRDVDAELKRISVLREKALALAPELKAGNRTGQGART